MARNLMDPRAKLLNHVEFVYAPGERGLAKKLFVALGCRVVDPQTDEVPEDLGPAAAPYLIIYLDPADPNAFDNVFYASDVTPVQWSFERALREQLAAEGSLADTARALRAQFAHTPQAMTHLGMAFPSVSELEAAVARIEADSDLSRRVQRSKIYRPGEPDSADDRVVQTFVHTDVCSNSLLATGQQFELQVRLDL